MENSLATEIITENKLARVYIDYLLGRVIKCETIGELRTNKIAITSDCMLYQGYVLRKINPSFYKYPIIGSNALEKQKQIKQEELEKIKGKILNEQSIIDIMENVKEMDNLSIGDIVYFTDCIKESKEKEKHFLIFLEKVQALLTVLLFKLF